MACAISRYSLGLLSYIAVCFLYQQVECMTYAVALLGCHLNHGNVTNSGTSQYEFIVINTDIQAIEVNVTNASSILRKMSIPANGERSLTLDGTHGLNGSEYTNKTIMVTSKSNFTLYVFSTSVSYSEGYLAIPMEELLGPHNTYDVYEYVVTTFCSPSGYCQLAVSAFQNTTVKFTFPERASDIVFCIGLKYFRSNRDTILDMAAYDVVQMESARDLSGTHIYSFSPIAVFVGARNLNNGNNVVHLMEQLPTASQWDKDFVITPLGDTSYGDIVKVVTSNWNFTLVEISGYGRFLLNSAEVLTRRIRLNEYAFITSDNPIQVVQISGFMDGSDASATTASHITLTTVQGSKQAVNAARISCGTQQKSLKMVVITGKTNSVPLLNGIGMLVTDEMGVTDYRIYTQYGRGLTINEVKGEIMTGFVQCENGAAFPLASKHILPKKAKGHVPYSDGTCIEGETFQYIEDTYGSSDQIISTRSFEGFSVLKLRVLFCGAVVIEFKMDVGSVIIRLTSFLNTISICQEGVCNVTYETDSEFNKGRSCESEMAWYWVRQNFINDSLSLDVGTGPLMFEPGVNPSGYTAYRTYFKTNRYTNKEKSIPLPGELKNFTMKGVMTDAFFNYDLEPEGGCIWRVSDWRCEDKIDECDFYGRSFCGLSDFNKYCPRYCGLCTPDGFGKRFIGNLPIDQNIMATTGLFLRCEILIQSKNTSDAVEPNIAIANVKRPLYRNFDLMTRGTLSFKFDLTYGISGEVWIVSDKDVHVTINVEPYGKNLLYNVYPVDTYDREYMTIGNSNKSFCDVITESEQATVLLYIPDGLKATDEQGDTFTKSDIFMVYFDKVVKIIVETLKESAGGIFLKSDKPISVFCGEINTGLYYNQILPSTILSTNYRIPNFNFSNSSHITSIHVSVQALQPDTIVEFISEFGDTKMLETEGDKDVIYIDTNSTHELISNNPISVAMTLESNLFSNPGFVLIPPIPCFDIEADMLFGFDHGKVEGSFITSTGGSYHAVMDNNNVISVAIFGSVSNTTMPHFGIMIVDMPSSPVALTTTFTFKTDELRIQDVCEISDPLVNDDIDNDCDGQVDEDVCCNNDLDLDGDFSDDFSSIFEDLSSTPSEPTCIPINKPDHQCWTLCQCPCSWVDNLVAASKMTHDEFMSTQMVKAMQIQEQLTVYTKNLTKVTAQKTSAEDGRQSAANVGYVGVALFMLTVAFIIFLDISAILRDLKIFFNNLKGGFGRLGHCLRCK